VVLDPAFGLCAYFGDGGKIRNTHVCSPLGLGIVDIDATHLTMWS
jgi:hypothetical protein